MTTIAPRPSVELVPAAPELLTIAAGDQLPAAAQHALALVLSHLFGGRSAGYSADLSRILRRYAHTDVRLDNGVLFPGPCPDVDLNGSYGSAGHHVVTRYGETVQSLRVRWKRAALERGGETLPMEMLQDLLNVELWPVLLCLIAEGPMLAAARLEMVLLIEQQQPPRRPDRRHHDDSLTSDGQLAHMGNAARALMQTLVELQLRSVLLGDALSAWQAVPRLHIPQSGNGETLTTGPRRSEVRLLWQHIQQALDERLPVAAELGEVEAIRRLSRDRLKCGGHFTFLRLRVLLVLMAVLGARSGAISRLRRCDFVRDHRFPDGSRGPAIALRPGKTHAEHRTHWKGIPQGAADVIEAYLTYMERFVGPFTPEDTGPLLHACRKSDRGWGVMAMRNYVAGLSGKTRRRAVLPRGDDPCVGFSCHTFRSFAAQTVRSLDAHALLAEWRVDASQHWIAEALLDHALGGMAPLYGGASKTPDREHLSAIGARVVWQLLTGDSGARRAPDVDRFRQTVQAQLALSAEVDQLGRDVDHAFQAPPPVGGDRVGQLVARVEQLMHAHALVRRERQAYEELVRIERELEQLRHDPGRQVLLPDDAPDELADVDLAVVEAAVRAGAARGGDRRPVAVREWLSVQEMRELGNVGAATVPRWLGQGGRPPRLPFPDGDPRNPWPSDRVPVDDSLGARSRRIIAAGISETWLLGSTGRQERMEEMLALTGPAGWPREKCMAPLVKPDWLP